MNALQKKGGIVLCALFLLAMMNGCVKDSEYEMTGGKKMTTVRTPTISEKDGLIEHFYLETQGTTPFMNGWLELRIDLFDPNDPSLKDRAGENTKSFEEMGYIFYMTTSYDNYVFPVEKEFMENLTKIVSESKLYTYSGSESWTSGLPEDAGVSLLNIEYESGNGLSHSQNGTIPAVAQDMIERIFPLLIETIAANDMSFVSLFNIYHAIPIPTEWIQAISMSMWSEDRTELYYYRVRFDDCSFHCLNSKGVPLCDSVVMEKEDAHELLRFLSESHFFYHLYDERVINEDRLFLYLVDFRSENQEHSATERYGAQFSYRSDTYTNEKLDHFFFHLINKYFRTKEQ